VPILVKLVNSDFFVFFNTFEVFKMDKKRVNALNVDDITARTKRGIALLDAAHAIIFTAWFNDYILDVGRSPGKFLKDNHVDVLVKLIEIYHLQKALTAEETFDRKTSPWIVRVRARAARIRVAQQELRKLAMASAPIEAIKNAKLRIKAAQAT